MGSWLLLVAVLIARFGIPMLRARRDPMSRAMVTHIDPGPSGPGGEWSGRDRLKSAASSLAIAVAFGAVGVLASTELDGPTTTATNVAQVVLIAALGFGLLALLGGVADLMRVPLTRPWRFPTPKPRRFEDYEIETGDADFGQLHYAALPAFPALAATGGTREEAIATLRALYEERVAFLRSAGKPLPAPRCSPGPAQSSPNDQVEALRPLVDEFWTGVFGTPYLPSQVSNVSTLGDWEHFVSGGRQAVIARVRAIYGVDLSDCYDAPIPVVLARIRKA